MSCGVGENAVNAIGAQAEKGSIDGAKNIQRNQVLDGVTRNQKWKLNPLHKIGPYEFGIVYCGDSRELVKQIPDGSIHLICQDPPYGSNNSHLRQQNITEETKIAGDDEGDWRELMPDIFKESARILDNKSSAICCFAEGGNSSRMSNRLSDWMGSFLEYHCCLVWNKMALGMGWKYRRGHEFIHVGHRKGSDLRWFDTTGSVSSVINIRRSMNPIEDGHPCFKPVPLMEFLIRNHTRRGDVVLDMFAGAGSTGVACKRLGRKFIGFELNKRWADHSNKRIAEEGEQGELFA